ncbi:unnamed protein product [Peronospora belbahrii]|uniref:Reverse transcriptase Ty1/copia-type domain-containing protein n=1 Tax=Peronospora belbahrii TaxID=622444 RepID=A0AAU9KVM6_9STRA|nr:unnamed protein product [Peronospora belbahrii]
MWVFNLKTDHLDNVVRFRARIVARDDKQRPGIDYVETFSPVARMAMFRLFVAVCVQLELPIYQGEINTAYLNATLGIKQYLESLEGYLDNTIYCRTEPCLYYYRRDGEFAIVLDDILCATENVEFKTSMFQKLDKVYGLKDQGFFNTYLGVEVEQNESSKIH